MNNRRKLVIALGAGALSAPFDSFAQQQSKVWRVGYLSASSPSIASNPDVYYDAFVQGMRELGYVEGKNLVIERRFGDDKFERLPALALELVTLKVDVIVAATAAPTLEAKKATATIPIIMASVGDPVGSGLVASLAHPGGNITGLSNSSGETNIKLLEILLGMVPKLSRVAVLVNPDTGILTANLKKDIQAAAQKINVRILPIEARTPQEVDRAFSTMIQQRAQAVIVQREPFFSRHLPQISDLAAKNRLPSIYGTSEYPNVGGLIGYGSNPLSNFRRATTYVDKILKGAKPADLPVEQPTRFELVINGKTATALGLKIPYSLRTMADKVIE